MQLKMLDCLEKNPCKLIFRERGNQNAKTVDLDPPGGLWYILQPAETDSLSRLVHLFAKLFSYSIDLSLNTDLSLNIK